MKTKITTIPLRIVNLTVVGLLVLSMLSCNERMDRLLQEEYPESGTNVESGRVLFIVIDGASGIAVNEAYNNRKAPVIRSMTAQSTFTFEGLADARHSNLPVFTKDRGWANLLTGTTGHGVGIKKYDGSDEDLMEIGELQTPSFLQRLKQVNSGLKTSLYASDADFFQTFGREADRKQETITDNATKDAVLAEIGDGTTSPSDIIVVQFGDVQKAGEANGFWTSGNMPTDAVIDAVADVDRYLGEIMKVLEARPHYVEENWLIVVTSTYGGAYLGSIEAKTLYDDPRLNTFSMLYNSRFSSKLLQKPSDGELKYIYITPVYTPAASSLNPNVAAVVKDASLFNMPAGQSMTIQFMVYDQIAAPSGLQMLLSKAANSNAKTNGEWFITFDGNIFRYYGCYLSSDSRISSDYGSGSRYLRNAQSRRWSVITVVHDFENKENRFYVNGALLRGGVGLQTNAANINFANNTNPLTIGQINTSGRGANSQFSVSNLQIYDRALPDDFIKKNYGRTALDVDSTGFEYWQNLIGYWPCDVGEEFDEDGHSVLKDYSRNGAVYGGVNAGKSDMLLTGNIQWLDNESLESNVRPLPNDSYYKTVFNTVDLSYQIFLWMGETIDPFWNLEGLGWPLNYSFLN
ncbi:MAG: hypothetical protein LBU22_14600 [Dysgonamonadaceae bacterium]|nr:hypothetical protein [Dysgonamonadaceae bacterium]